MANRLLVPLPSCIRIPLLPSLDSAVLSCPPRSRWTTRLVHRSLGSSSARCLCCSTFHFVLAFTLSRRVYGVTCLQVYSYFVDGCSGDTTALKVFVVALLCVSHHQDAEAPRSDQEGSVVSTPCISLLQHTCCTGCSSRTSAITIRSHSSFGLWIAWRMRRHVYLR
jgi:hypothetical protein